MKVVILAAGEGRRLEPLTDVRPKPMLPVANKPLLEYVVDAVVDAGVDEIVLVVGYKRERIQDHFGDGDDWDVDIEYVVQDKQLGTGHAILQAEPCVDGPFLVLNGDRILSSSVVTEMHEARPTMQTLMAVTRSEQPADYGVVEIDGDRVTSITEKPPRSAAASEIINAGVYRFEPSVFDVLRDVDVEGELTVTAGLQALVTDGEVGAVKYDDFWLDVSYLWDYLAVNGFALERFEREPAATTSIHSSSYVSDTASLGAATTIQPNATVLSGTTLGDNVSVGPNAVLANCVVLPDTTIDAGVVLRDCIVGENAVVGPGSTAEGGRAVERVEGDVYEGARLGGVIGDNARLGGNVTIASGASIGTGATVEGGCFITGPIPTDADVRRG